MGDKRNDLTDIPPKHEERMMYLPGFVYKDIMERLFKICCLERDIEDYQEFADEVNDTLIGCMEAFYAKAEKWSKNIFDMALISFMCGMSGLGNGLVQIDEAKFRLELEDFDFMEEEDDGEQQAEG